MPGSDFDLMRASWADFVQLDARHAAVAALTQASQLRRMKRGAALLIEGQLDKCIYLLVSGSFRTLRYHADGQEVWLTDAAPGELVGEIAALTDAARTSSVFARTQACVVAVEQASFLRIAAEHGSLGLAVARLLAQRLAQTSRRMADLAALPVAGRLHRELMRLGQPSNIDGELVRLETPPTVSALALRIHASREATSRAVSELETHRRLVRNAGAWIIPMPMEETDPVRETANASSTGARKTNHGSRPQGRNSARKRSAERLGRKK